jgi:hypothetical protein
VIPGYTIVAYRVPKLGEWFLGANGPEECKEKFGISCYYLILVKAEERPQGLL